MDVSGTSVELNMSTMSKANERVASQRIGNLQVRGYNNLDRVSLPAVYVTNQIPMDRNHIPTAVTVQKWPHLARINSEVPPLLDVNIGLLIGYDGSDILCPIDVIPPSKRGEPFAQKTILGWSVIGGSSENDSRVTCHRISSQQLTEGNSTFVHQLRTKVVTPDDVSKLLDYEFSVSDKPGDKRSLDDERFMDTLSKEVNVMPNGHLEMPLPFRTVQPVVPNNRCIAEKRFNSLRRKMKRDPKYEAEYMTFMNGIIDKGFAEKCDNKDVSLGHVWYLPHHGVYHPKKKKLRVVFDASSKHESTSLNELLMQGPELTNTLLGVLCRFRRDFIAICCDIEQMFYQFYVAVKHRDYLRFLWFDEDRTGPPVEYRMTVHLFGASSSPGCANFGLKYVAELGREQFGDLAADFVQHCFYVDDGLTSVSTADDAIELVNNTVNLCKQGGIRLHKFVSNSQEVLEAIPDAELAKSLVNLDFKTQLLKEYLA